MAEHHKSKVWDRSWEHWIDENVSAGCCKKELLNILTDAGFDENESRNRLNLADTTHSSKIPANNENPAGLDLGLYLPESLKIDTDKAEIYAVENFLNEEECIELIELIRANLRRSTTTGETEVVSSFRTSKTCDMENLDNPLIADINSRICKMMGIESLYSEPIQGQWYQTGDEFKAHTDYFEPQSAEYDKYTGARGQRTWTFMIYLNNTRKGGATRFTELELEFLPRAGTAVIWNNVYKNGSPNPATLHHGTPVDAGYKVIITKWFRSRNAPVAYVKEENEHIPPLTRNGFLKYRIPEPLFVELLQFYKENRSQPLVESIPEFIVSGESDSTKNPSELIKLSDVLRKKVHETLQPIVEAWIGDFVEPTYVYGIRNYLRSSVLKMHRDRLQTHIASIILNIDQSVEEDWPLQIEDHHYRTHNIVLKPGEMILYEGARLSHGRPTPLQGDSFANIFVHFRQDTQGAGNNLHTIDN